MCSCICVRSRAGADDALIRGSCASAARSLRKAIHRWNARTQYMHTQCMHVSTSMRLWLPRRMDRRCGPPAHTRARAASVRMHVCACARVRSGAHASAPTHASAFRRRGPRVARGAGVRVGVGVQREHRRVEHCACHLVVCGMRRLSGPGGAPLQAGRARRCSMRRGPLCAAAPPMRARARVRRRVGMRMRGRPLV